MNIPGPYMKFPAGTPFHRPAANGGHAEDLQPNEALDRRTRAAPPIVVSTAPQASNQSRGRWQGRGSGRGSGRGGGGRGSGRGYNHNSTRGNGWNGGRGGRTQQDSVANRPRNAATTDAGSSRPPGGNGLPQRPHIASQTVGNGRIPQDYVSNRPWNAVTVDAGPSSRPSGAHRLPQRPHLPSQVLSSSHMPPMQVFSTPKVPQEIAASQATTEKRTSPADSHIDLPTPPPKRQKLVQPSFLKEEQMPVSIPPPAHQAPFKVKDEEDVTPSPGPSRRLITSGSQWYHPMPEECMKSNRNFVINRKRWRTKECDLLKGRNLQPTKCFFRDDGMVIDWESTSPVWSDTLEHHSNLGEVIQQAHEANSQMNVFAEYTSKRRKTTTPSQKAHPGPSSQTSEAPSLAKTPSLDTIPAGSHIATPTSMSPISPPLPRRKLPATPHAHPSAIALGKRPREDVGRAASQSSDSSRGSRESRMAYIPDIPELRYPSPALSLSRPYAPHLPTPLLTEDDEDVKPRIVGSPPPLSLPSQTHREHAVVITSNARPDSPTPTSPPIPSSSEPATSVPLHNAQRSAVIAPPPISAPTRAPSPKPNRNHSSASGTVVERDARIPSNARPNRTVDPPPSVSSQPQASLPKSNRDKPPSVPSTPAESSTARPLDVQPNRIVRPPARVQTVAEFVELREEMERCALVYLQAFITKFEEDRSALAGAYAEDAAFSYTIARASTSSTHSSDAHLFAPKSHYQPPGEPFRVHGVNQIIPALRSFGPHQFFPRGRTLDLDYDVIYLGREGGADQVLLTAQCEAVDPNLGDKEMDCRVQVGWTLMLRDNGGSSNDNGTETENISWPLVATVHQMTIRDTPWLPGEQLQRHISWIKNVVRDGERWNSAVGG